MPSHDFRSPRLFVEADLAPETPIAAGEGQANYLLNVLRLAAGDGVLLFNGRHGEWRAHLARPSKKTLEFRPAEQIRAQPQAPSLHYLFAPLKQARLDYMVQKAVEMGAGLLQPVMTQHVQAPRVPAARLRANAIEAAEQCGILCVPECRGIMALSDLLAGFDRSRRLVFCDEREAAASPLAVLRREAGGKPVSLLIGPEGGFSEGERRLLRSFDFVTVLSLGPRILRADTAAVAALAVIQAAVGDWHQATTPDG